MRLNELSFQSKKDWLNPAIHLEWPETHSTTEFMQSQQACASPQK